jgi:hypothetical protein
MRKFHMTESTRDSSILVVDDQKNVVCTLPWQERRLAKFIIACANVFGGVGIKRYDRSDWMRERNIPGEHSDKAISA